MKREWPSRYGYTLAREKEEGKGDGEGDGRRKGTRKGRREGGKGRKVIDVYRKRPKGECLCIEGSKRIKCR